MWKKIISVHVKKTYACKLIDTEDKKTIKYFIVKYFFEIIFT